MHQLCSRGCVPFLVVSEGLEPEIEEAFQGVTDKPQMLSVPRTDDSLQGRIKGP